MRPLPVLALLLALVLNLAGAVGLLLGPTPLRLMIVPAFLVLILVCLTNLRDSRPWPDDRPRAALELVFGLAAVVAVPATVLGFVATFGSGCAGGGADLQTPVLAEREVYVLTDHGQETPVSRWRYVVAGTGFVCAWCGGLTVMICPAGHSLLRGKSPLGARRM